jgi:hypothetical protein
MPVRKEGIASRGRNMPERANEAQEKGMVETE